MAETLTERLCDPKQYEDALLEIKTTLDTVAGSSIVHEAFRALRAAIAERDGQVGALVDEVRALLKSAVPNERDHPTMIVAWRHAEAVLANLPAAAARDERLRAEAAVEALRPIPCSCRTVGTTSEDAAVITCLRCRVWSYYKAEAARLREEAGR